MRRTLGFLYRWSLVSSLFLILVWLILPSPLRENDQDYARNALFSHGRLTRVYQCGIFRIDDFDPTGFALDYAVSSSSKLPTLVVSGSNEAVEIYNPTLPTDEDAEHRLRVRAVARTGCADGINLPWFDFADSILLFWWIHQDNLEVDLTARWTWDKGVMPKVQILELMLEVHDRKPNAYPLLSIQVKLNGENAEIIKAIFPTVPTSSSPTVTYPVRVAIACILTRPTLTILAILNFLWKVREKLGSAYSIPANSFLILAGFCSFLRCTSGPSFEVAMENIQEKLEISKRRYEGNRSLVSMYTLIEHVQKVVEAVSQSEGVMWMVGICRVGWHPERSREKVEDSKRREDIEKGASRGVRIRIQTYK